MSAPLARRLAVALVAVLLLACRSTDAPTPVPAADLEDARTRWTAADSEPLADSEPPDAAAASSRPAIALADGLALDEALELCAWLSPRLRLARLEAAAPRAAIPFAGRWDDPKVSLEARRVLGGVDEPEILGAGIAFTIPLGGQKRAALETARAKGDVATFEARVEEWNALYELRREWIEWTRDGRHIELLDRLAKDLDELIAIARRLADGGVIGLADVRILELEQGTRGIERRRLDAAHRGRRLSILASIGLSAKSTTELVPHDAVALVPIALADRPRHLAEHHPELSLALVRARLANALDDEAWRKALPELTVEPGYEREDGEDKVGVALEATLPLWNANRAERAEAAAAARAAKLAVLAKYKGLLDTLATKELELEAAAAIATTVETALMPLARAQLEALREQARLGSLDALRLIEAVVRRHETEAELIDARRDHALAAIAMNQILDDAQPHAELAR